MTRPSLPSLGGAPARRPQVTATGFSSVPRAPPRLQLIAGDRHTTPRASRHRTLQRPIRCRGFGSRRVADLPEPSRRQKPDGGCNEQGEEQTAQSRGLPFPAPSEELHRAGQSSSPIQLFINV